MLIWKLENRRFECKTKTEKRSSAPHWNSPSKTYPFPASAPFLGVSPARSSSPRDEHDGAPRSVKETNDMSSQKTPVVEIKHNVKNLKMLLELKYENHAASMLRGPEYYEKGNHRTGWYTFVSKSFASSATVCLVASKMSCVMQLLILERISSMASEFFITWQILAPTHVRKLQSTIHTY